MLTLKLAYRNLIGAGLKTWLKVAVLSLSYVLIIWHFGIFTGMYKQASRAMIKDEIGGGQYWHKNYDPYDPMTLDDSHGTMPKELNSLIETRQATPILIRQASIYPQGRAQSILLKGIDPDQTVLGIPSAKLKIDDDILPILIGRRMAKSNSLKIGDYLTVRWRDANGTFDAVEGKIVEIMNTEVPTIDVRQIWIPLKNLQNMTGLNKEVTIVVVNRDISAQTDLPDWKFKNLDFLLTEVNEVVKAKIGGAAVMYAILLFLAMLAIFDTQILSIFRRRKEIGTLMALGMTRGKVIILFTIEGALVGVLALIVGAIYGVPLIYWTAVKGISFPAKIIEDYGIAIAATLFPAYSAGLVLGTVVIIMIVTTIVSYLPTREIAKLKPTEALKGKVT